MAAVPGFAAAAGTAAASTTLTTIGTFVFNLGASYLLSRLAAQDGPRLDNLTAAGGEYGVGMPRLYGENCRVAGIFIAQADIKETRHTVEDYSEIVGALTGAAAGFMLAGPIGISAGLAAAGGALLGGLLGFATPDQHYYTYSDTFALMLCDRTGDLSVEGITRLWAANKKLFGGGVVLSESFDDDGRLIMRKWGKNKYYKSLALYTGHTEQGIDPVLASVLGEDGAYPFTAYIVVEDLQLAQFGNSVPAVEALVKVRTGDTLAAVAERICAQAGIVSTQELSTSALVNRIVRGFSVTNETNCWDAFKPLFPAFGVDAAEVSGQIRFLKRSQAMRATIPFADMGGHAAGDDAREPFTFSRETDLKLPRETSLTFIDPARDYQSNEASSARVEGNASSNVSVTLPLVLTADEGASAAALMHWDAWLGRTALGFALTDQWIGLEVGCAYAVPFKELFVPYRITRRTRGANGVIEVEAVSDEEVTYSAFVAHTSGTLPDDDEETAFPETRLILMDTPITADDHDDFGFYVAVAGDQAYWERGKVQASSDGTTFATLIDTSQWAVMGDVTGALAAGSTTGLDDTLDTESVLTVVLLHDGMELQSKTDAQLDAWANFAFVGKDGHGEYIQWKTATKIAPKTWELTDLRRGRKGTDWALGTHVGGEEFCVLGEGGVFRIVYSNESAWGDPLTFRGVSLHEDEADAETQVFTNTGEGKRPYSPVEVEGSWDGSNNLTISWTYRSRMNSGELGQDDQDNYEVEITSGAGRTITATGTTSAIYSAADQTTDGLTPGDSIAGRVRQLSDVNDGRWRDFFLVGPGAAVRTLEDDTTLRHLEDGVTVRELE
jgi:hypothetical protein